MPAGDFPETLGMGMRVEDLMDTADLTGRMCTERPLPDEFHQNDPAFGDGAQEHTPQLPRILSPRE